jgi:hypothetical protein
MIKIADLVSDQLMSSEIALSALSSGYLNLSAYAVSIQPQIERLARKPVRAGTIVVALSRLAKSLTDSKRPPLLPEARIENISVKTGLVEIAFDKSKVNRDKLQRLYQDSDFISADFFAVTHGVGELSIVIPEELKKAVLKLYGNQKPKLVLENLASLTLRYDEKNIYTPNITFAVLRPLALKRINIVEIVSTFTELTFILDQDDLQEAFLTLNPVFQRSSLPKGDLRKS